MTDRGRLRGLDPHAPDRVLANGESLEECCDRQADTIKALHAERARIARILIDFTQAPISMASLQPILDLAVEFRASGEPK